MRTKGTRGSAVALLVALGYFVALFAATRLLLNAPVTPYPWGMLVSSLTSVLGTGGVMLVAGELGWEEMPAWGLAVGLVVAGLVDLWSLRAGLPLISSLAVLLAAVLIGALVARYIFLDPDVLAVICALYIIVDIYSVYLGPTGAIVARGGPVLAALTVHFPIVGSGQVVPLIGITDFAVWTACLVAARRFGFDYRRSFLAMAGALALTSVMGVAMARPVPALPLMMAAYLVVNRRGFRFRQRELWATGLGALVIVLLVGILLRWLLTR